MPRGQRRRQSNTFISKPQQVCDDLYKPACVCEYATAAGQMRVCAYFCGPCRSVCRGDLVCFKTFAPGSPNWWFPHLAAPRYCHFCQHVKVRASSMLACSNTECSRRFCEHCLLTHLNEDVDPTTSTSWITVSETTSRTQSHAVARTHTHAHARTLPTYT